nr:pirin family protein [Geobacter sp. OR-1]
MGFPTHPHRGKKIISSVLEGALEHKNSMGNRSVSIAYSSQTDRSFRLGAI